ncbi:2Fe-2S iron-sulfur cluster-binding protein [Chitinophaga japonensis]|uniref:NADH-quinone oxidoreductase subunit G n=1 Tax=Chitinophaga japonensis TaxID=104662 RepID=A0A562TB69_CHIJA|nr:2Fe-2S iron-sulfur cluster-binding protein [Chitinophaga japonensis]TWI90815.1 NADH-quinone oxidoreductase subunit G [Chitinophaga japonensis]
MSEEKKLFKVKIDNISVEVEPGTTILNAARRIGGDIVPPAMCYYSKLEGSGGKCRTCLVKVTKGSDADPRPIPKLVASCRTNVMDGMEVANITSPEVQEARKGVVEFLLLNHPLDCPICDQAGECHLQDLGYEHGADGTRYEFKRRTFEQVDIGDKIKLHMTRCILCYRCVFTADQLTNRREHGVLGRGEAAEIGTYIHKALDNDFIGNVIDVCPVGALTDKTFRFKNRVWFLKPVDAHRNCDKCCGKTVLWMRGDEVFRVTARKDQYGEVEEFICDTCRFETKDAKAWTIEGPRRIDRHSVISQSHYVGTVKPKETITDVMDGRSPRLLMDIHSVSQVNRPEIDLSKIEGPAHSDDFKKQ